MRIQTKPDKTGNIHQRNTVVLPGHRGITCNERADLLANKKAEQRFIGPKSSPASPKILVRDNVQK